MQQRPPAVHYQKENDQVGEYKPRAAQQQQARPAPSGGPMRVGSNSVFPIVSLTPYQNKCVKTFLNGF